LVLLFSDSRRSAYFYATESWQRFARRMALGRISAVRFAGAVPDRLIVAPIDLRMADPHIAAEIYSGRFALGGRLLDTQGTSPFQLEPPSLSFARSLHGFGWLRHMRAADHDLAFANARSLVDDWIGVHGRTLSGLSHEPDVVATRLIAWLSHSPVVLRGADHGFYRRFLKSIALQIRYLRHVAAVSPDGAARFKVRIALAMASLCAPSSDTVIRTAARHLDFEFDRQILPDGGHVSRNAVVLVDLLTDLLPLRQTYVNLGQKIPARMVSGMDRMFCALRFFRHSNGELALFNGASAISADRLMAVLRYDETSGVPYREMPHSRYQRLAAAGTVVLADTSPPLPGRLSQGAYAGCLSFEMSSGANRFFVNAGAPVFANPNHAGFARLTAAHTTVVVEDTSSLRVSGSGFLGAIVIGGVRRVDVQSLDADGEGPGFGASHDGYIAPFGVMHRRQIRLSPDGAVIEGTDEIVRPGDKTFKPGIRLTAVARFHVHPKIGVYRQDDGSVHLVAQDGDGWIFACPGQLADVEDDVHFADLAGARASRQITIAFHPAEQGRIVWHLKRLSVN